MAAALCAAGLPLAVVNPRQSSPGSPRPTPCHRKRCIAELVARRRQIVIGQPARLLKALQRLSSRGRSPLRRSPAWRQAEDRSVPRRRSHRPHPGSLGRKIAALVAVAPSGYHARQAHRLGRPRQGASTWPPSSPPITRFRFYERLVELGKEARAHRPSCAIQKPSKRLTNKTGLPPVGRDDGPGSVGRRGFPGCQEMSCLVIRRT